MTSLIGVARVTRGMASPVCMSEETRAKRLPSLPPGCRLAKSSSLNPRRWERATASASPSANMAVVEAVGASPSEQASCATEQSRAISAACARVDRVRDCPALEWRSSQVMVMSGTARRFTVARSCRISAVSPLAESASTTSPRTTIPRSPCRASAGWRNSAGLPVEVKVAAILRATMPLLPMPVTITRPAQQLSNSTARSKSPDIGPARRSARAPSASASMRMTRSPMFFICVGLPVRERMVSLDRRVLRLQSTRIEYKHLLVVGAAGQGNVLAVKRDFHLAGISGPENYLIGRVNGFHLRRLDHTPNQDFAIGLDGNPGTVFG